MKKILFCLLACSLLSTSLHAGDQKRTASTAQDHKMQWWQEAKLGMFVHWGPYALYGGVYKGHRQRSGGAEWIMNRSKIPYREYRATASTFNPVHFDAEKLVLMAKNAGMKYLIFTSKHHDGFAMFKSEASRFNIVDYTPFKRDVVDELVQACRKHDMKLGFYYSQCQDWCHPGGATVRKLMKEGWANPDSVEIDAFTASHGGAWDDLQRSRSFDEYFHTIALPQIKELLSRYGDIAVMWFDTPHAISKKQAEEVMAELVHYPQVILNDRLKRPDLYGDYKTPENMVPKAKDVQGVYWETCMNIGSSWGYKSWENKWKSSREIIRTLLTIAARGGNYLLNVGPDALGDVPEEAQARLRDLGQWLNTYGEAVYGTTRSELTPTWGECIRKDLPKNTVYYLCVFNWPEDGNITLDCPYKVKKVSLVKNQQQLPYSVQKGKITVKGQGIAPDEIATIIKVELKTKLSPVKLSYNADKHFDIADEK